MPAPPAMISASSQTPAMESRSPEATSPSTRSVTLPIARYLSASPRTVRRNLQVVLRVFLNCRETLRGARGRGCSGYLRPNAEALGYPKSASRGRQRSRSRQTWLIQAWPARVNLGKGRWIPWMLPRWSKAEESPSTKGPCEHGVEATLEVQGVRCLSARSSAPSMQGVRWAAICEHGRVRSTVQGVRWVCNLRARSSALSLQGVRWVCNLRARSSAL